MEPEPKIERTADAKRLQLKSWKCQECGSMHSQSQAGRRSRSTIRIGRTGTAAARPSVHHARSHPGPLRTC